MNIMALIGKVNITIDTEQSIKVLNKIRNDLFIIWLKNYFKGLLKAYKF